MRKLFKKIAAVAAAVAMVTSMATTAFAEDKSVEVTVEWKDAPGDVNVHTWGAASTSWPGQKMTANGDGTYTTTIALTAEGNINFVVNVDGDANKTEDIKDVDTSTGKILIKVSKNADGKLVGVAEAVKAAETETPAETEAPTTTEAPSKDGVPPTGDSTAVIAMIAVAAVAGALVVATKKQTVNE